MVQNKKKLVLGLFISLIFVLFCWFGWTIAKMFYPRCNIFGGFAPDQWQACDCLGWEVEVTFDSGASDQLRESICIGYWEITE